MKAKHVIKILVFLIAFIAGIVISQNIFNDFNPWIGLISYCVVIIVSVYFIFKQIKNYF